MKKMILLLALFMLLPCFTEVKAKDNRLLTNKYTLEDVKAKLPDGFDWVPFPDYINREDWNELFGKHREEVIEKGNNLLNYKWQVTTFTSYLEYRRSGSRKPMEATYNSNIRALSQLLLAELAEGKGRFIDQIIDGSMMLCEMTSWSLAAHLVVQPSRSPMPNHKYHVIELVSGDLSALLAWTNYFLKDEFDKIEPEISERIVYELNRKTIHPYMDGNKYWWMGLGKNANRVINNWNPWCNSNVLVTALLTVSDQEELAEVVYKTMRSIDGFFNYVKADGACEEGPSYWQHAAGKAYDYLNILSLATSGELTIFDEAQIRDMGEYIYKSYIGDGWMVNFADAEAKAKLNYYHIYRYGKAVNSHGMMEFAAYLHNLEPLELKPSRDFFDTLASFLIRDELEQTPAKFTGSGTTWYPDTQFFYCNYKGNFFASKGGHNQESHNHNDVGTFILYLQSNPVFIDAGVGTYTAKTFSSRRYELWNVQSQNHNLPMINGVQQRNGRKYAAENIVCKPNQRKFSLDIAKAYPEDAAVKFWNRSYNFKSKELVIKDDFELIESKSNNIINFITLGQFQMEKEGVLTYNLKGKLVKLYYNADQFDVTIKPIELDDIRFIKFWGERIYKISLKAKDLLLKDTYTFKIKY